jgi:hypothetical protein
MKLMDITADLADSALIELARHIRPRINVGHVKYACKKMHMPGVQFICDLDGHDAVYFVNTGKVDRFITLGNGENEYTEFRHGEEFQRVIVYDKPKEA